MHRYGVRTLFGTVVVDTILGGGDGAEGRKALRGLIVENVAGRQAVFAKQFIDCSGNADVLHRAGGRFTVRRKARKRDGEIDVDVGGGMRALFFHPRPATG